VLVEHLTLADLLETMLTLRTLSIQVIQLGLLSRQLAVPVVPEVLGVTAVTLEVWVSEVLVVLVVQPVLEELCIREDLLATMMEQFS
jgi:hypothetical protein